MKRLTSSPYQALLQEITSLYINAKKTIIITYWTVGKCIVEAQQRGADKAPYGEQLIKRLSKDLTRRIGKGFSKTNLERMRLFYKENPIAPALGQLSWSKHVELLSIKDSKKRRLLQRTVVQKKLSFRQVHHLIQRQKVRQNLAKKFTHPLDQPIPKLKYTRGVLNTYSIVKNAEALSLKPCMILDLGFNIWKMVLRDKISEVTITEKPAYCYPAFVERIIDGDTLWVRVDCGFSCFTRQKLRLRAVDCPELDTQEGKTAKKFVQKRLWVNALIVVKTYREDKYGRYLADVFYLQGEHDPDLIAREGIFLNQELLNEHLAVRMR